jgi:tetratricopeptide (TPR) repeat protein
LEYALEEKPDFDDASVNLALVLCEMGETMEAVRRMRPIIRRSPESSRMNFFYGAILYRHGDYKEALAKYQKAISLEPDYTEAQVGLGETLLRLGQIEEAESRFRALLKQHPNASSALYLLGLCLLRKADASSAEADRQAAYEEAGHCFESVLVLDGDHIDALVNRIFLMGKLDSVETMNNAFEQLIQAQPATMKPMLLYYWSKALTQLDQAQLATEKLAEARTVDPDIETRMESLSV